jgi:hypothetical protein
MSRRAARATQADIERAIRAADAQRARTGGNWRVRIERDGAIVLEPAPAPRSEPEPPQIDARPEIRL